MSQKYVPAPFPRIRDNLVLIDYPQPKLVTPIKVDSIQTSIYDYITGSTVTTASSSAYTSNLINNLIPNPGHLYLVIPTVCPEVIEGQFSSPASTGTGGAVVLLDGDTNFRITNVNGTGAVSNVFGYESPRVRMKFPGTVAWWGIDQSSNPGAIDWLDSSPDFPNPTYMFAVTDMAKTGTISMQFEMPTSNMARTAGMSGHVRFYIAFVQFSLLDKWPGIYTPVPTNPPAQSASYQFDPGARGTPPAIPSTF